MAIARIKKDDLIYQNTSELQETKKREKSEK